MLFFLKISSCFKFSLRKNIYNEHINFRRERCLYMQTNFKRTELKYKLTKKQYNELIVLFNTYMVYDNYGETKIKNIYFDTADYKIIRNSIDKPVYKEKLRIRKYDEIDYLFVELKKKFEGIVYKRRFKIDSNTYTGNLKIFRCDNQIGNEIHHFLSRYDEIDERVYLSYERDAYKSIEDNNLRITFDTNIRFRDKDLSFNDSENDQKVLSDEYILMEIKTLYGYPRWLLDFLNSNKIYKTSFSKYGTAYKKFIFPKLMKERE